LYKIKSKDITDSGIKWLKVDGENIALCFFSEAESSAKRILLTNVREIVSLSCKSVWNTTEFAMMNQTK